MRWMLTAAAMLFAGTGHSAVLGVYDADGRFVGRLMSTQSSTYLEVTTVKGYVVSFDSYTGEVEDQTDYGYGPYLDSECKGPTYTSATLLGLVVENFTRREYAPAMLRPDATPVTVPAGTVTYYDHFHCPNPTGPLGYCAQNDPGEWPCRANTYSSDAPYVMYALEPTDPAVTGVPTTAYRAPFRFLMLHGDWTKGQLMEAGFESKRPAYWDD